MQKLYNTISGLGIVALVAMLLLQKSCTFDLLKNFTNGEVSRDTVTVIDTVHTVKIDSFYQIEYVQLPAPPPEIVYMPSPNDKKSAEQAIATDQELSDEQIAVFEGTQSDSAVDISYVAQVAGYSLLGIDLKYKLKQPIKIIEYRDRTITKTETVTVTNTSSGFYIGGRAGYSPQSAAINAAASLTFASHKGNMYEYSYDFMDRSHHVGIKRRLFGLKSRNAAK